MPDIAPILARLKRSKAGFESVVSTLPVEAWRKPPQPGAWSAAEIVAHLTMVEQTIIERAARLVDKSPNPVPLWKRFHTPCEWRNGAWSGGRRPSRSIPRLLESETPCSGGSRKRGETRFGYSK